MNQHYHIIGAGGVGSWLCPSLCLLVGKDNVTVHDGDTLEYKNLNRQLFTEADIGKNKAEALAERYGCGFDTMYLGTGTNEFYSNEWLICCADNHPARAVVLEYCDSDDCQAIIAANETTSAEAFLYHSAWEGGATDPRVYYPEIINDRSGDPRARAAGCTGQAQEATPQLVSANFMAAALAQHLIVLWAIKAIDFDEEVLERLPYHLKANLSSLEMLKVSDKLTT